MPRDKTVSFKEYGRRLSEERVVQGLSGDITPRIIHQKMDSEGVQFKVTVSDKMRMYWQAKLEENPEDDTAMRVLYIANGTITLVGGVDHDKDMECFILDSVETDGFCFDLPPFFEIRTQDELNRMDKSLKQSAVNTSFFVDVFDLSEIEEDTKPDEIGELTEQQKALKAGIEKTKPNPKPPKKALELLILARNNLENGECAKPPEIYNWLVRENEKRDANPLFEHLEFYNDNNERLAHYGQADNKKTVRREYVLYWDDTPRKGSTFENWCSATK